MVTENMTHSTFASPHGLRNISGTIPGVLDPTQVDRLFRLPNSKLSFAAFNPRVACAQQDVPDLRKLSLNEELYRPKRVVIETIPTGESFWRFVPSARKEDGVSDEGRWPRIVELCGEQVECSQDQWDIYKLDSDYECCVKVPPSLSTISRVPAKAAPQSVPPESPSGKRRIPSPSPDVTIPAPNPRKKVHTQTYLLSSDEDEVGEVEGMIIDDGGNPPRSKSAGPNNRAKMYKDEIKKNRMERREKAARRAERLARQQEEMVFDFSGSSSHHSRSIPPEAASKRKVNSLFNSLRSHDDDPDYTNPVEEEYPRNTANYAHTKHFKRTRTVSPSAAKRDLEAKRLERERQKKERRERELNQRRLERDNKFMQDIYAEVPDSRNKENGQTDMHTEDMRSGSSDRDSDTDNDQNGAEAARLAAIAESRRKLAELEADRPLWEQEARKRTMQERAEQEARRVKAEEKKRVAEAERKANARREELEARRHEEEAKQEREEAARRQREKNQRQQRWSYGPWTTQRALERYKVLSETFDSTKFSENEPLTSDAVPWPVLQSPASFSIEDVDWATVERFYEAVKSHMRPQDYKTFVEKSHRRFHPDRWRSRSLLKSVVDEAERDCMEVAANTVAQALTPLWQELTGR